MSRNCNHFESTPFESRKVQFVNALLTRGQMASGPFNGPGSSIIESYIYVYLYRAYVYILSVPYPTDPHQTIFTKSRDSSSQPIYNPNPNSKLSSNPRPLSSIPSTIRLTKPNLHPGSRLHSQLSIQPLLSLLHPTLHLLEPLQQPNSSIPNLSQRKLLPNTDPRPSIKRDIVPSLRIPRFPPLWCELIHRR